MSFTLTVTASSLPELLAALNGAVNLTAGIEQPSPKAPKPKAEKVVETATGEVKVADAAAKVATPEPKAEAPAAPAAPEVPYADVAQAVFGLHAAKGEAVLVELLGKWGVKTAKELKPEQYGAFLADIAQAAAA